MNFTAYELKTISEGFNKDKDKNEMKRIMKKLRDAAFHGKNRLYIASLTDSQIEQLKLAGYEVNKKPYWASGAGWEISWKNRKGVKVGWFRFFIAAVKYFCGY